MKIRNSFVFALALTLLVSFGLYNNAHTDHWASDLYAQSNPIPSQNPVFGSAVITGSGTSAGLPALTSPLRYYIQQAQCVNVSASTVVAGGIVQGNGSTPKLWIPCPAAGANTTVQKFDPPLQITAGSQVSLMTGTAVQQVFFYLTGYSAR